jgi:NADH:ubiquinone oxidoreductase subunit 6 (subunit J)
MLASLVAITNPFPFSISGFTGLTAAQIISFFIVFVIFNAYVVLTVIALVGFYFTSKPRRGKIRTAAIWHFVAILWMLAAFVGTVWGAPAEKTFLGGTGLATLGIGQRAINEFISMGFAFIALVCMAIGFARAASQNRAIREEALAAV